MEQDRQRDAAGLFRAFALPNADTTLQAQCCGELHRRIADSAVQIEEARSDAARNAAGSTVRGVKLDQSIDAQFAIDASSSDSR